MLQISNQIQQVTPWGMNYLTVAAEQGKNIYIYRSLGPIYLQGGTCWISLEFLIWGFAPLGGFAARAIFLLTPTPFRG